MLVCTDSDKDAVPSAAPAGGDVERPPTDTECQAVTRLARAHFGCATALVTLSNAQGQRLKAVDGALPDVLPPDLSGPSLQASTAADGMVVVPDTWGAEAVVGQ